MQNISILGAGNLAKSLAIHYSRLGISTYLWEYVESNIPIYEKLFSEYLDKDNKKYIHYSSDIEEVISKSTYIIVAIPSEYVVITINKYKNILKDKKVIIGSKGMGEDGQLFSDLIDLKDTYYLYGPSIAKQIAEESLTGLILSGRINLQKFIDITQSKKLRITYSTDYIGCQIAAIMKNVLLIYLGILEGLKVSDNTYAYYFVEALKELSKVGEAMGGNRETFYSLSGLGDMMLNSRNKKFGIYFGQGYSVEEILDIMNYEVEGYRNAMMIYNLVKKYQIEAPIFEQLYGILYNNTSLEEILR